MIDSILVRVELNDRKECEGHHPVVRMRRSTS